MIAKYRARLHLALMLVASLAAVATIVSALVGSLLFHHAAWIGGGVAVINAVLHWAVTRWNPNRNLERNRKLAQEQAKNGKLQMVSTPDEEGVLEMLFGRVTHGRPRVVSSPEPKESLLETPPQPVRVLHGAATLLALGASAVFSTLGLVMALRTWPLNPDWNPPVVGPGDACRIRFPDELRSLGGYWKGFPVVIVRNSEELGFRERALSSSCPKAFWPTHDWKRNRADSYSSFQPSVDVTIPEREDFVGKTLNLEIELVLSYPTAREGFGQGSRWRSAGSTLKQATELRVGPAGAATAYSQVWWITSLTGTICLVVAGILYVLSAKRQAAGVPAARTVAIAFG
jgi:hypothetical protein